MSYLKSDSELISNGLFSLSNISISQYIHSELNVILDDLICFTFNQDSLFTLFSEYENIRESYYQRLVYFSYNNEIISFIKVLLKNTHIFQLFHTDFRESKIELVYFLREIFKSLKKIENIHIFSKIIRESGFFKQKQSHVSPKHKTFKIEYVNIKKITFYTLFEIYKNNFYNPKLNVF